MAERHRRDPDFRSFHRSIVNEMNAMKDRVGHLIQDKHWLTVGESKKTILRSIIRRHLPDSMIIGRGFVVGRNRVSTQIDVLIVDGGAPVLFREGDLMIVTPDAVRAAIEVKTRLQPGDAQHIFEKLGRISSLCLDATEVPTWTGLFAYEADRCTHERVLTALSQAGEETRGQVSCIACGQNDFFRYWSEQENSQGRTPNPMDGAFWRSYSLDGLAPSYFVGNLLSSLSAPGRGLHDYAWFPEKGGKESRREFQIAAGQDEPVACN